MASIDSLLKRAAVLQRVERRRGRRVQPRLRLSQIGVTSLGGLLAVGLLALLSAWSGHVLIVAPVGASSVLLFGYPRSPLAQPRLFFGRGWPTPEAMDQHPQHNRGQWNADDQAESPDPEGQDGGHDRGPSPMGTTTLALVSRQASSLPITAAAGSKL